MSDQAHYNTGVKPNWCKGCGNFAIWTGVKNALVELGLEPWQAVAVFGIGCHGHMVNFLEINGFEGLHGRPIPVAIGIKLANHSLPVIVSSGDGDCFGEGGNHFIHAARGNHDITVVVHDNQVYGLTTGQASPTSEHDYHSKSTPQGVIERPVNPITLALASHATYVARAFSGDIQQLTELVKKAMLLKGFALVDILQPCVTFNKLNTYRYFYDRVYKLEDTDHDPADPGAAYQRALEWGDSREQGGPGIPTGLFYQVSRPAYHEHVRGLTEPLVDQPVRTGHIRPLMEDLS